MEPREEGGADNELLFVYGTLTDPVNQKTLWGRAVEGSADVLYGYSITETMIDNESFPIIMPSRTGRVSGQVLKISTKELHDTDVYETSAYKRVPVQLESGISAWAYARGGEY